MMLSSERIAAGLCLLFFTVLTAGIVFSGNANVAHLVFVQPDKASTPSEVQLDVDGDGIPDRAIDANLNPADGYEKYVGSSSTAYASVDVDGDGKIDHLIDTTGNSKPDVYWDPDDNVVTNITAKNVDSDPTKEYLIDSNGWGSYDHYYDPDTGEVKPYHTCAIVLLLHNRADKEIAVDYIKINGKAYALHLSLAPGQRQAVHLYNDRYCAFTQGYASVDLEIVYSSSGGAGGVESGKLLVPPLS